MGKKPTTFGLSRRQLARLWATGSDIPAASEHLDEDEVKRQLLHDTLAGALPLEPAVAQLLPEVLGRLCEQLRPFASASFGRLLVDPQADVEVFVKIHDAQKQAARAAKTQAEREVATVIYYGAIAAALVHHGRRITRLSCKRLGATLGVLLESAWLTPELTELFKKAQGLCEANSRGLNEA